MSFIDFIEKLQNKPKYIRIQILVVCVTISMAVVIFFWLLSFESSVSVTSPEPAELQPEVPSLIQVLKASIGAFFEKSQVEIKEEQVKLEPAPEPETIREEIKPARLPISQ